MVQARDEIKEEYKWDLSDIYSGEDEWRKDRERLDKLITQIKEFEGEISESPEKLYDVLEIKSEINRISSKLGKFARMKSDQDLRKERWKEMKSKASSINSAANSAASFVDSEIRQMDEEQVREFVKENQDLQKYEHYLDNILRMKAYSLSKKEEEILSEFSDVMDHSAEAYQLLSSADIKFPEVEKEDGEKVKITQSNFTKFLKSRDRELREEVFSEYYDTLSGFENTIGANLENTIKRKVKEAEKRGYDSSLDAALYRSNVDEEVYRLLINSAEESRDLLQRHVELKRRRLGVDEIQPWDLNAPASEDVEIPLSKARELIIEALEPMGEDYVDIVKKALNERWIDFYENEGKRNGGYQSNVYDTHPFILINYQENISSVYTLIHEIGHAVHSYLSSRNHPYVDHRYDIFEAEIASRLNELFLTDYIMENEEGELRERTLEYTLDKFKGVFFRQSMFASFEEDIHAKMQEDRALTSQQISRIYRQNKDLFYGDNSFDERIKYEWMRVHHFQKPFYVYKYSTGRVAAQAFFERVNEEGPEDVIEFLKTGGSKYPLETLRDSGIDMKDPENYEKTLNDFQKRIEQIEDT